MLSIGTILYSCRRQLILLTNLARQIVWAVREYEGVDPIIVSVNEEDKLSIHEAAMTMAVLWTVRWALPSSAC